MQSVDVQELPIEKMSFGKRLSHEELLAVVIGSGSRKESVFDIAKRAVRFDRHWILTARPKDISRVYHIGIRTACRIKAVTELSLGEKQTTSEKVQIEGPSDAALLARSMLSMKEQEELIAIFLDTKNKIISSRQLYKGTLDHMVIHPRDILREALKANCAGIILAHNHPSGDPEPSEEDIDSTLKIAKAARMIGIPLKDHIIIGEGYRSMKEDGLEL